MRGIYIDIADEVLGERMGFKITHKGYSWKRAQLMVQKNNADAFITTPTIERKTYTLVSTVPVLRFDMALFTHSKCMATLNLDKVKTIEDLNKFRTINYFGNGWAKQNLAGMAAIDWVPTMEDALNLLSRNQYDVYVGAPQTVRYYIKTLGLQDRIIELPNVLDTIYHHLCIGKNSPFKDILPEFDQKLKAFRDSGKLLKIYEQYQ